MCLQLDYLTSKFIYSILVEFDNEKSTTTTERPSTGPFVASTSSSPESSSTGAFAASTSSSPESSSTGSVSGRKFIFNMLFNFYEISLQKI